jgi:hypothetical protein
MSKFAFIYFRDPNDSRAGFIAASEACKELDNKEIEGYKLTVIPA